MFVIYRDAYEQQHAKGYTVTLRPSYFIRISLGIFWECTTNPAEAKQFPTRAAAVKVLQASGKHRQGWRVIRAEAGTC